MLKLMMIIDNQKEKSLLRLFLEQQNLFKIVDTYPNYANYLRAAQYKPDLVLIEIPQYHADYLNFLRLFRRNNNLKKTKVVAYGDHTDQVVINTMNANGVHVFLRRPIKTENLMHVFRKLVPILAKPHTPVSVNGQPKQRTEDLQIIMDSQADKGKKISLMAEYVSNLLAFPFTVTKVLQITQDADSGAMDLVKTIGLDPVISARILKLANSVLFSSRNQVISDIKQAIVRIGFRETKNLVMGMSVMKLFAKEERSLGFDRMEFWYHSLASAVIAELLSKKCGYPAPEEMFMAGLLHDFGIMILDEFFSEVFALVIEKSTRQGTSFIREEEALIGITHNDVAAQLFEKWNLPQSIRFAMQNHQLFNERPDANKESLSIASHCVGLANLLSKVLTLGRDVDQFVYPVHDTTLAKIKCLDGLSDQFFDSVYTQFNLFCKFLNLDDRQFPDKPGSKDEIQNMHVVFLDRNNHRFHPIEYYLVRSQRFHLTKLASDAQMGLGDTPPNLLVIHVRPDDTGPGISALLKCLGKSPGSDVGFLVPTLILHAPDQKITGLEFKGRVKTQADTVDLHNIDMTISQLLGFSDVGKIEDSPEVEQAPTNPLKSAGLTIDIRIFADAVLIFDLSGAILVSTLDKLKSKFMEILQTEERMVALNLALVKFIDSSGLGLIINFHKRLNIAGGNLCLLQTSDEVKQLIAAVKLDKILAAVTEEKDLYAFFNLKND